MFTLIRTLAILTFPLAAIVSAAPKPQAWSSSRAEVAKTLRDHIDSALGGELSDLQAIWLGQLQKKQPFTPYASDALTNTLQKIPDELGENSWFTFNAATAMKVLNDWDTTGYQTFAIEMTKQSLLASAREAKVSTTVHDAVENIRKSWAGACNALGTLVWVDPRLLSL
ncbi:hypothetical protein IE81DRAFT_62734 [Ceraceosorus guamensis]|uniref:Uncharacterized protein n=1 Tax=Ceraceosorus guamensis TaxID=1522189 RepID=A0A316VN16_9BASI|nr:hypothetical protein IE81DRAFT_62734 [Ceraceosorus guamensis]PWN38956.1 hypothetical protein IE81DRAFT_62734 [Ceraceosorus guamensis]